MPLVSNVVRRKAGGVKAPAPYSDDVFATLLYTGTGAQQTFYPGFTDLDQGVAFLSRYRTGAASSTAANLWDTKRGINSALLTTSNAIAAAVSLAAFNPTNLVLGPSSQNTLNITYASWFFKMAKSFFQVVPYVGNGAQTRAISHDLQNEPGLVIAKTYGVNVSNWSVWHRSAAGDLILNSSGAQSGSGRTDIMAADSTSVTLGWPANISGAQYELFIFAHDISDSGIIRCDKYTTDASGNATVNVGFDIQYLLLKAATTTGDWRVFDTARGFDKSVTLSSTLVEITGTNISLVSNGFAVAGAQTNTTFVYMAIRKRNKPNTSPNSLTIQSGNSIDVYAQAIQNGWDQVSPLTVTIAGDVGSNSTAEPALLFSGSYPDVTLIINSGVYVCGRGGLGASAAVGNPGGPAIKTTGAIKIINNGVIGGGGGGGGGYYRGSSYGYGGNGAGLPLLSPLLGTIGTQATAATKTNGGNGAWGQSATGANTGGTGGAAGSNGASGSSGSGGGGGLGGSGGASSPTGSGYTYSDPGGNGQAGPGTTDSDATYTQHPTYAGGAAGPYIVGNSNVTWLTAGTRYGAAT